MKPVDAIKQTLVEQGFSQPAKEYEEKLLDVGTKVRYHYEPGELEGYQYKGERRKRSTDPIWSVDVYKIKDSAIIYPKNDLVILCFSILYKNIKNNNCYIKWREN